MSAYRVGGGRNLIRFFPDHIAVPDKTKRQPVVFPRDGLSVKIVDVLVKYRAAFVTVGSMRRGKLITLRRAGVERSLSTLILEDEADEPALVADLERFVAGQAALGRAGHSAPKPRTDYDDRLDRELAQLD
jgi:hypothetical protein